MSQEFISGKKTDRFDEILIEAIDYGLESIGRTGRALVYQILESKYRVKQNEIPLKLEDFSRCLDSLFGSQGATLLERLIAKNLYRKLELNFPNDKNRRLINYVKDLTGVE